MVVAGMLVTALLLYRAAMKLLKDTVAVDFYYNQKSKAQVAAAHEGVEDARGLVNECAEQQARGRETKHTKRAQNENEKGENERALWLPRTISRVQRKSLRLKFIAVTGD
eukprot:1107330-Prorocentrum_minimum.AAC.4